jgi:V/A-type H+-transporting ATPase subunit F
MEEKSIYVVGNPEFMLGFRLAGIKNIREVDSTDMDAYIETLDEIVGREDAGLVIVDGSDFEKVPIRKRTELESLRRPIIVTLSKKMVASESLRNKIIQAVGVDLLK